MLIHAQDLCLFYGQKVILFNVNLKLTTQSRIGLVGANGAGKSTLIKCLMQQMAPHEGSVTKASNIQVKCLTQNPELTPGNTLKQELYSVFDEIQTLQKQEEKIIASLAELSDDEMQEALIKLATIQEKLDRYDVGKLDEKIGRMITGLGFSLDELDRPVDKFSGGWQMRINLAKVLLQEADLILMDEPTNHLDMEACAWLEDFLRTYPKGILVVSHDRRFLDQVVTEIAELERGELTLYAGNYTKYKIQKEANREIKAAAAARQEKLLAEQRAFVDRFRASATKSTQAKSREKQLDKIEIIEAPKSDLKKLFFKFPPITPSYREVLKIENLSKSFGEHKLFAKVNLDLEWTKEEPQRVFILGANGCGKTTFFKILMGLEEPTTGSLRFGERVMIGYYAQHQLQILDSAKTVFQTLEEAMPKAHQNEVRSILGRFLFSGDQVHKEVGLISGGEKAKLAIAKLMVTGPNTLLLDEPTNHLDTPSQEAVEGALKDYEGTVIAISHDRYFIENHATQIWEFYKGNLIVFKGRYKNYLEKRSEYMSQCTDNLKKPVSEVAKPTQYELFKESKVSPKQVKTLEKNIEKLQKEKSKIEEAMLNPAIADNYHELTQLTNDLEKIKIQLDELEHQWLDLTSSVL
jgi:ATP-binding cassette subfamily F protein 3